MGLKLPAELLEMMEMFHSPPRPVWWPEHPRCGWGNTCSHFISLGWIWQPAPLLDPWGLINWGYCDYWWQQEFWNKIVLIKIGLNVSAHMASWVSTLAQLFAPVNDMEKSETKKSWQLYKVNISAGGSWTEGCIKCSEVCCCGRALPRSRSGQRQLGHYFLWDQR